MGLACKNYVWHDFLANEFKKILEYLLYYFFLVFYKKAYANNSEPQICILSHKIPN